MSEEYEKLEAQLSEAASEVHDWENLLNSPGWARLMKICDEQQKLRCMTIMLTPTSKDHNFYAQEYIKGEFGGIGLVINTPEAQLVQAKTQRSVITQQLENESEIETRVSTADADRRIPEPGDPEPDPFGE